jgi:hypothetical protein
VTKTWGRRQGINPVWYLDITPGHDWLTQPINRMVEEAIRHRDFDADILLIARTSSRWDRLESPERSFGGSGSGATELLATRGNQAFLIETQLTEAPC